MGEYERVGEALTRHLYSFLSQPSFLMMGLWLALAATLYLRLRLASLPRRDKSQAIVVERRIHRWTAWLGPLRWAFNAVFVLALLLGLAAAVVQTGVAIGRLPEILPDGV